MWKMLLAFIVFAVVALFVLKRFGGDIDMGGEKHGIDSGTHAPAPGPAASS